MIDLGKIYNLTDYLRIIDEYFNKFNIKKNNGLLYRGQSGDWPLIPSLARLMKNEDIQKNESSIFSDFKRYAIHFLNFRPPDDWEWLTIGQHFGLPTRLLDWTKNPLTALWFATNPNSIGMNDFGIVWLYHSAESNHIKNLKISPFEISEIKIYIPLYNNARINAQSGIFTIHNFLEQRKKFIPLQDDSRESSKLAKIWIPSNLFNEINIELERLDIHLAKLFPDLDGLAKHLRQIYF